MPCRWYKQDLFSNVFNYFVLLEPISELVNGMSYCGPEFSPFFSYMQAKQNVDNKNYFQVPSSSKIYAFDEESYLVCIERILCYWEIY